MNSPKTVLNDFQGQCERFCLAHPFLADAACAGFDVPVPGEDCGEWKRRESDPAVETLRTGVVRALLGRTEEAGQGQ